MVRKAYSAKQMERLADRIMDCVAICENVLLEDIPTSDKNKFDALKNKLIYAHQDARIF